MAILMSLMAAGLVLYLRGATINMIMLAGLVIALGAIVDDAIIDVENIVRRLRQHRKEGSDKSTVRIILEASFEMRSAIVYATVIIVLAVVPVLFLEGLSGALFQPLAYSYVLALLVSMVVALTVTPALSLMLLRNAPLERGESLLVRLLNRVYDAVFSRIIHKPRLAFAAVGVIVYVGFLGLTELRQPSLLPTFKEMDLLIKWEGKPGTSRPAMSRIVSQATHELRSIPGVRNVGAHVGRAMLSDEVVNVNSSELWVRVDPAADYDATVAAVQKVVDGYPGLYREVLTYLKERTGEARTGADEAVVRIYGHELDVLRSQAEKVKKALSKIDGIADLRVEGQVVEPGVEIEVDLAAAERYGIKPGDVRRASATLLSGIAVGSLFEEQKVFDVVVWGTPEIRHSLNDIGELLLDTPSGGHVRLGEVADVRIVPTPTVIKREAVSRYIDVVANGRGGDFGSVAGKVKRAIAEIKFPLEYRAELRGDYLERQAARNSMIGFGLAAAIGIFLLLQVFFRSWRLATVVFLTLPMALVGGVLAAFAGGGIISLGSIVGFVTVLGIAVRNCITLIARYQNLERHEGETFGPGLVLRGTRERFAPILMTAATTGLAFLPLALFGDIPGLEIVRPMAVVILGGLVTSTLLNLHVVPAMYLRFGGSREPDLELLPAIPVDAMISNGTKY